MTSYSKTPEPDQAPDDRHPVEVIEGVVLYIVGHGPDRKPIFAVVGQSGTFADLSAARLAAERAAEDTKKQPGFGRFYSLNERR